MNPLYPAYESTPPQHIVYRFAKAGNIDKVKYWLETERFPIDQQDFYSNTVLYYACLCNHPPLASYLMERGATFQPRTMDGRRTYLASANQIIRNILMGKADDSVTKTPIDPFPWFFCAIQKDDNDNIENNASYDNENNSNNNLFDVSFLVGGKKIFAHKCILAARCPNLLLKLEKKGYIQMSTVVTEEIFNHFLKFVYTDKIEIEDSHRKILNQMAKKLDMPGLEAILDFQIGNTIDPNWTIGQNMKTLVNNPLFSDVELVIEGGSFYAHKIILSTRCDYFKALFSTQWVNSEATKITMQDISSSTLSIILDYIYSGTYEVNEENIIEVLEAADLLLIPKLKTELEFEILKHYLDAESCLELAHVSQLLHCTRLFKASVRTIVNNIQDLCQKEEFLDSSVEIKNEVFKLVK